MSRKGVDTTNFRWLTSKVQSMLWCSWNTLPRLPLKNIAKPREWWSKELFLAKVPMLNDSVKVAAGLGWELNVASCHENPWQKQRRGFHHIWNSLLDILLTPHFYQWTSELGEISSKYIFFSVLPCFTIWQRPQSIFQEFHLRWTLLTRKYYLAFLDISL